MTERLLQFIWQFQHFNKNQLTTAASENLQIIFPGRANLNQGPDFLDAKIRVDQTTWAGSVELHFKTSDWEKHRHHVDSNYSNVILHVVWEDDVKQANAVPVLELGERVSKILLEKYGRLMNSLDFIACAGSIQVVRDIVWSGWKDRLLAERLSRKTQLVEHYLGQSNYHWEETFWWLIARNFGAKVNADAFEAMARSLSLNILAKHKNQIHQLEALLLGQSNLLKAPAQSRFPGLRDEEDYPIMLKKEYEFLKKKYGLKPIHGTPFFLRMRPGNFPTIRLAQLAMLVHRSAHLFSKIKEARSLDEVKRWLDLTANDYWHYHYRFDHPSSFKEKKLGTAMIDNIVINTIVPMIFAYGAYHQEERFRQKALQWLEKTAPESNAITRGFRRVGIDVTNAFDSQALIELRNEYCNKKKCLECAVGNAILKG